MISSFPIRVGPAPTGRLDARTPFISFTAKTCNMRTTNSKFLGLAVLLAFSMSLARAAKLPPVERLRNLMAARRRPSRSTSRT